ncbi:MAG: hypothetical protein SFW62_05745 [Alphaproteobacteria bacterium]|nr:hypothetical protein [Alphaproteobacteria bacterium]
MRQVVETEADQLRLLDAWLRRGEILHDDGVDCRSRLVDFGNGYYFRLIETGTNKFNIWIYTKTTEGQFERIHDYGNDPRLDARGVFNQMEAFAGMENHANIGVALVDEDTPAPLAVFRMRRRPLLVPTVFAG